MNITKLAIYRKLFGSGGSTSTLDGDGQDFHQFAPTALTFRSEDDLADFQEVQINGETLDASNYTLTEGSTIVTLSPDYLKTLDAKTHEITIVSTKGKTSANFSVTKPELNEYGFYYNQPYTAYVDIFSAKLVFFVRDDGTADTIFPEYDGMETVTYVIDGDNVVFTSSAGDYHCTVSADGTEIYCNELATNFVMGDNSIIADEDYIYTYREDLGGYEVKCIDKTQASYGAIKTGINGIDTVRLEETFMDCESLVSAPKIPNTVVSFSCNAIYYCTSLREITIPASVRVFEGDFVECYNLSTIIFEGTMEQWNAIEKNYSWNSVVPATYVQCSDGQVALV